LAMALFDASLAEKAWGNLKHVRQRRMMTACGETSQLDQEQPLTLLRARLCKMMTPRGSLAEPCKRYGDDELVTVRPAQADLDQPLASAEPPVDLQAEDAYVDAMCNNAAEDLSTDLSHALEHWPSEATTMASCALTESNAMRKLYLHMISTNPSEVLEKLAVPLKNKLLQSSGGALVMDGPGIPIRLSQGFRHCSEQVLEK